MKDLGSGMSIDLWGLPGEIQSPFRGEEKTELGLAIQHFSSCDGELVHLVSSVCLVCVVRGTRETRQPRRSPRALAISYMPYAIRSSLHPSPHRFLPATEVRSTFQNGDK